MTDRYLFDRAGAFYPLVISYLVKLHGIKVVLGFSSAANLADQIPRDLEVAKLLGPLELIVRQDSVRLNVELQELAQELVSNLEYLLPIYAQSTQSILSGAHEAVLAMDHTSKLTEFLRHARNAAAHSGNWHLLNGEPRRPAEWRGLVVSPSDNGRPLLKLGNGTGSLELGDPIALLWDIEQECKRAA